MLFRFIAHILLQETQVVQVVSVEVFWMFFKHHMKAIVMQPRA